MGDFINIGYYNSAIEIIRFGLVILYRFPAPTKMSAPPLQSENLLVGLNPGNCPRSLSNLLRLLLRRFCRFVVTSPFHIIPNSPQAASFSVLPTDFPHMELIIRLAVAKLWYDVLRSRPTNRRPTWFIKSNTIQFLPS